MTLIFWLQFAAVCVAGAMSPGPSLALVIRNSTKFSRIAGLMTAIGHGLGMGIYAVFAVTGLVIVITTNVYLLFEKAIDSKENNPNFQFYSLSVDSVEDVVVENDLISIPFIKMAFIRMKND